MKYRQSIIEDSFSIASSGTKPIDILGKDLISRLTILPKITNPNAYVAIGHPDEIIEKIELIDGNDVLVCLTGTQAKALAYYSSKKVPVSALNYMALQWSMVPIDIYFGRYLYDPLLALDPKRFTNLQLKITHNVDASMTGAAAGYITVKADVFDENPPSPMGFLTSNPIYNLTLVASSVSYIDLPEDLPIRILMSHCFSDTQAPEYQVSSLKLTEAHDKRIIFDSPMEELQQYAQNDFPPWDEKVYGRCLTTDLNFWITPAFERTFIANDYAEANSVITPEATGGQKVISSAESAAIFEAIARGWAPHGSLPLVYPHRDEIDEYWDVKASGGARLKVTVPAANGGPDTTPTWDVIAQQLRT